MPEPRTAADRDVSKLTLAAVGAAVLGSLCCVGPAVLAVLGLGGMAAGAAFAPYRPLFIALAAVLFGLAIRAARRGAGAACCVADRHRSRRAFGWLAAGLLASVGLLAFPAVQAARLNRPNAADQAPVAQLHVAGMTCADCALHVQRVLEQQPGVTRAVVDLDTGTALVYGTPSAIPTPTELASAVSRETPYQAAPEVTR